MYAISSDGKAIGVTYFSLSAAKSRLEQLNYNPPAGVVYKLYHYDQHTDSLGGLVDLATESTKLEVWAVVLREGDGYGNSSQRSVLALYADAPKAVAKLKEVAQLRKLKLTSNGLETTLFETSEADLYYAVERWEVE